MSNNAPFCTLELSKEEAELLLRSATQNVNVSLMGMQMGARRMSPETLKELVGNNNLFMLIRQKLLNQGVQDED